MQQAHAGLVVVAVIARKVDAALRVTLMLSAISKMTPPSALPGATVDAAHNRRVPFLGLQPQAGEIPHEP